MHTRPTILLDSAELLMTLTERQREIATLASQGLSNKMIGNQLGVTEGTVKIHLYAIYKKLEVRSRIDLIIRFGNNPQQVAV
jgi:two-component system nitrate/nitrite response regulator NarL